MLKGFRDYGPEEEFQRQELIKIIKNIFEKYGYVPIKTPALEKWETLASKYGGGEEILKETYKLEDQGRRKLGLRYDLTVPLARYIKENPNLKLPFKRYQIGEAWRDGPVSSTRLREFTQCDADIIGVKSMKAEAEILALTFEVFKRIGLEFEIKLNNRKLLNGLVKYAGVENEKAESVILSIDKLEKIGKKEVEDELKNKEVPKKVIEKLFSLFEIVGENDEILQKLKKLNLNDEGKEGVTELENLLSFVKILSLKNIKIDLSLARGLSYYTSTIFETFLKNSEVKTAVASGGRYNRMIGKFIGRGEYPAVGISFGTERICEALGGKYKKKTKIKVFVIPIKTFNTALEVTEKLRSEEINADIDLMDRGISKNLDYASKRDIPYVAIMGKKEIEENKLKLKNMKTGEEKMLSLDSIIEYLKSQKRQI